MSLLASIVLRRSRRKKKQQLCAHAYLQGHCWGRQVWVRSVCTLPWSMPGTTCAALLPLPSTLSGALSPPVGESGAICQVWASSNSLLLPSVLMQSWAVTTLGFILLSSFCVSSSEARESFSCETQSPHLFSFTGTRKEGRSYLHQQFNARAAVSTPWILLNIKPSDEKNHTQNHSISLAKQIWGETTGRVMSPPHQQHLKRQLGINHLSLAVVRTSSLPRTSGSKCIKLMPAYSLLNIRQEFLTLYCQLKISPI